MPNSVLFDRWRQSREPTSADEIKGVIMRTFLLPFLTSKHTRRPLRALIPACCWRYVLPYAFLARCREGQLRPGIFMRWSIGRVCERGRGPAWSAERVSQM